MPNPTLPAAIGLPVPIWKNDANNWRADDAIWLLSRTILRFPAVSDWQAASTYARGGIAFLDASTELAVAIDATNVSYILNGKNLKASDDGILYRPGGSSVTFTPTSVDIVPLMKVAGSGGTAQYGGTSLSLAGGSLALNTGTGAGAKNTITSTNDLQITAPNVAVPNNMTVGGSAVVTGSISVNGSATFAQPISAPQGISGAVVPTADFVVAPQYKATFGDTFVFNGPVLSNTVKDPTLDFTGRNAIIKAATLTLKVGAGGLAIDDGSPYQAMGAGIHVDNRAPVNATDNYPLGTIWVQV
jgi:hypothetical protein